MQQMQHTMYTGGGNASHIEECVRDTGGAWSFEGQVCLQLHTRLSAQQSDHGKQGHRGFELPQRPTI